MSKERELAFKNAACRCHCHVILAVTLRPSIYTLHYFRENFLGLQAWATCSPFCRPKKFLVTEMWCVNPGLSTHPYTPHLILIAPRLCRPAIPHIRSLIQGDAPVLRRRHPIDVPAAQPCALGEMSPPHHSVLVMARLGWLEQGHARGVTIAAAQSSQGSLAESLACRVCFT